MTDLLILQFRRDAAVALKAFTQKLLNRTPLLYKLTKAVSCFDPSLVYMPEVRNKRMKDLLTILTDKNWISGTAADEIDRAFVKLCSQSSAEVELQSYSRANTRLDHFWRYLLLKHACPNSLLKLLKIVMILSHGKANIERGFSVNAGCLVENLKNETLVAQRMTYYSVIKEIGGDITTLNVPKPLIHAFRNSRSLLSEETERRKKEAAHSLTEESRRKRVAGEKRHLESKKAKLLAEVHAIDEHVNTMH